MSFTQDYVGTFIEVIMIVFLMNLFSGQYLVNKIKMTLSITLISLGVAILDILNTPYTTLLNYVLMVILFTIFVKRKLLSVLFETIFASSFMLLIEYILAVIFYRIQGEASLDFSNRLIQLGISLLICYFIGKNSILQKNVMFFYKKYQEEICFIAVTLFSFSAIELHLWKSENQAVFNQSTVILVYTVIWFCLTLFLLKKLVENRKQRENIHLHEQYMGVTENLLDSLYSEKHDFNKHLQAVEGLCRLETPTKAVEEIELYINSLKEKELNKRKSTVSINTGNGVVNALLYSKNKEAEKRNINLYYLPSGNFPEFPCEKYELVQIIGNLLDNAIEYVGKLEEDERRVLLYIGQDEYNKKIEVRNTYCVEKSGKASISQIKNYSTKYGERRGYGLQNVRAITLKYHGKFNIFQEENEFIAEILF